MKYIAKALMFMSFLAFAGCDKNEAEQGTDGSVIGHWHLESWDNESYADVYVAFDEDGTFDLYQRVYSPYYEHLTGTYSQEGRKLAGTYDDGTSWAGNPYSLLFFDNGNTMKMTRLSNPDDVSVYRKSSIPKDIVSGSLGVKSSMEPGAGYL